jgi:hypothetical protein
MCGARSRRLAERLAPLSAYAKAALETCTIFGLRQGFPSFDSELFPIEGIPAPSIMKKRETVPDLADRAVLPDGSS